MSNELSSVGACVHLLAAIGLFWNIWFARSCRGVSGKSQFLYILVFATRCYSVDTPDMPLTNMIINVLYVIVPCATLASMVLLRKTYQREYDKTRIEMLIISCIVIAFLVHKNSGIARIFGALSVYLNAVATIPQFQLVIEAKRIRLGVFFFIAAMAVGESINVSQWIYQCYGDADRRELEVAAGVVQFLLYCDFFIQILPCDCKPETENRRITVATVETGVPKTSHQVCNISTVVLTAASDEVFVKITNYSI